MKKYNLYIDESGIANLLDLSYKHFLLAGVLVSAEESENMNGYFNILKRKYGLNLELPFHSYDLFEDQESDAYLDPEKAKTFVASILEFLKVFPLQVKVLHAKKNLFRKLPGLNLNEDFKGSKINKAKKEIIYTLAATQLFYWFAEFLHSEDAYGQIIADSRKGMDTYLLQAYNNCKEQTQRLNKMERWQAAISRTRLQSITFSDKSSLTGGLEIVDLVSYSYFHLVDRERRIEKFDELGFRKVPRVVRAECNDDCYEAFDPNKFKRVFNKKTD